MKVNTRILVTGHDGFLGRVTVSELQKKGYESILGLSRSKSKDVCNCESINDDLTDVGRLSMIINRYCVGVIFHLAAQSNISESLRDPAATLETNTRGTWNILEAARRAKVTPLIILASSDAVYGDTGELKVDEKQPYGGTTPYAVSKICAEIVASCFSKNYKVNVGIARFSNIYGPGDKNINRLIPGSILEILEGREIVIRGDGKSIRDFIYVEDAVKGLIALMEKMKERKLSGHNVFNFSSGKCISILKMAEMIAKIVKKDASSIVIKNELYDETPIIRVDSGSARTILGWHPAYELEEGLKNTIQWFKDYHTQDIRGEG